MGIIRNSVDELRQCFTDITKDPTSFLKDQPEIEDKIRILVKLCYDNSKTLETSPATPTFTLPKLIIKNFDLEQIWQQIELQNKFALTELGNAIQSFMSTPLFSSDSQDIKAPKKVRFAPNLNDVENADSEKDTNEELEDENQELGNGEGASEEEYHDNEGEETLSDDDTDNDAVENENIESSRLNYQNEKSETNGSADNKDEIKSTFEERQRKLQQHVEKLEGDLLTEKPWQLKGEVTAKKRPQNSLLEEVLEFDLSSRPAPIITEEAALKLEDVIKNRIINKVWDDVERKIKPIDTPREFKKKLVLDQEKSKLSLAQVYEQDYLKQRQSVNPENKYKEDEEPKEHKLLRVALNSLFQKLDALTNYHFTPLPPIAEPQIVTNLPAVALEEAIPDATSIATLLAPEEIQGKVKGDLISKEERTTTDKKRARRKKKIKQKMKFKEIKMKEKMLLKLKPMVGSKYAEEKVKKDLEILMKDKSVSHFREDPLNKKSSKSSEQFFQRLQDATRENKKASRKRIQKNITIDPKRIKL